MKVWVIYQDGQEDPLAICANPFTASRIANWEKQNKSKETWCQEVSITESVWEYHRYDHTREL